MKHGDPILFDVATAELYFGVKPTRIRQWAHRGKLLAQGRNGRRHLYDEADIRRLLDLR